MKSRRRWPLRSLAQRSGNGKCWYASGGAVALGARRIVVHFPAHDEDEHQPGHAEDPRLRANFAGDLCLRDSDTGAGNHGDESCRSGAVEPQTVEAVRLDLNRAALCHFFERSAPCAREIWLEKPQFCPSRAREMRPRGRREREQKNACTLKLSVIYYSLSQ